jgi:hypothetical protein
VHWFNLQMLPGCLFLLSLALSQRINHHTGGDSSTRSPFGNFAGHLVFPNGQPAVFLLARLAWRGQVGAGFVQFSVCSKENVCTYT